MVDYRPFAPHGWKMTESSLTDVMLVIPNTKHIASKIFDLPDPLRPVIALKDGSQPEMVVRTG